MSDIKDFVDKFYDLIGRPKNDRPYGIIKSPALSPSKPNPTSSVSNSHPDSPSISFSNSPSIYFSGSPSMSLSMSPSATESPSEDINDEEEETEEENMARTSNVGTDEIRCEYCSNYYPRSERKCPDCDTDEIRCGYCSNYYPRSERKCPDCGAPKSYNGG